MEINNIDWNSALLMLLFFGGILIIVLLSLYLIVRIMFQVLTNKSPLIAGSGKSSKAMKKLLVLVCYLFIIIFLGFLISTGGDDAVWTSVILFGITNVLIWNLKIVKNLGLKPAYKVILNIMGSIIIFVLSFVLMYLFAIAMLGIHF